MEIANKAGVILRISIDFNQCLVIQWEIEGELIEMMPDQTVKLINLLTGKRNELKLSVNEVARRAGVDTGTVWRIEQGMIAKPRVESLIAIAKVLGISPMQLFTTVGWLTADDLPDLGTYLNAKFADLPESAVEEAEHYVDDLRSKRAGRTRGDYRLSTTASCPQRSTHCPQCPCAPKEC
ncbi:helix-turn-helix domain-containing protein [Gordonia aichiensis]|nr:helix-turn-helix transcriptional regulator [Gordonia aichiensis]